MNRALLQYMLGVMVLSFGPWLLLIFGLFSAGIYDTWVDFPVDLLAVAPTIIFTCSFMTGAIQHFSELRGPLREWVRHRGISRSRIFGLRVLASVLVIGLGYPIAIGIVAMSHRAFFTDGALVSVERYLDLVALSSVALSGYALGVFALVQQGGLWRSILTSGAATAAIVVWSLFILTPTARESGSSPFAFASFHVATAAILLLASAQRFLLPVELDRPESLGSRCVTASVAIASFASLAIFVIGQLQAEWEPSRMLPRVVDLTNRGPTLLTIDRLGEPVIVDDDYQVVQYHLAELRDDRTLFDPTTYLRFGELDLATASTWLARSRRIEPALREERTSIGYGVPISVWFLSPSGRFEFLHRHFLGSRQIRPGPSIHEFIEKPGGRFSARADIIQITLRDPDAVLPLRSFLSCVVGDPEDGSLWRVRAENARPTIERIAFPNGDRFVTSRDPANATRVRVVDDTQSREIIGESATYRFEDDELIAIGPPPDPPRYHVSVEDLGEYGEVRVAVEDRVSGEIVLTHDYRARTQEQSWRMKGTQALSMLRPPFFSLLAHLSNDEARTDDFTAVIASDPVVRSGRGRSLVLGMLALAVLLAILAARRLSRLGAERGRIAFWTIAILASGPIGFLVYRSSETDRAWAKLESDDEDVPLLIRSVA